MKRNVFVLALVLFLSLFLISCNKNKKTTKQNGVIPTYEGMTISHMNNLDKMSITKINEINDGYGHKTHDINLEKDITELLKIDIEKDEEIKYYVTANEVFLVEIHISNPNQFEIQSFISIPSIYFIASIV